MTSTEWLEYHNKVVSKYWKTTNSKLIGNVLNKLDNLIKEDFQTYYLVHSLFLRLFLKKQNEELMKRFGNYKSTIDANNFVDSFFRR